MPNFDSHSDIPSDHVRIYSYDKSLRQTVENEPSENVGPIRRFFLKMFCGRSFQVLFVFATMIQTTLHVFLQFGFGFLEKEPPIWECYDDNSQEWFICDKKKICGEAINTERYRPVESEDEYLSNWVQQYDILCEPKWKIGLIGTIYFTGALITILPLTYIADANGRQWISFITNLAFCLCVFILANMQELDFAYFMLFLAGATFGGRMVVGQTHLNEYMIAAEKQTVIEIKLRSLYIQLIFLTLFYQFGTKSTKLVALVTIIFNLIGTFYIFVFVDEAP